MSELILVTGGVRSGKSSYAQRMAESSGAKVFYIATAEALDGEMKKRIKSHRRSRARTWVTIEEPVYLAKAINVIAPGKKTIILDCLTLFISNLIHEGRSDAGICSDVKDVVKALREKSELSIVVTNEVGNGIVPDNELARRFCDLQGKINQIVSAAADSAYLLVSGIPVKIK